MSFVQCLDSRFVESLEILEFEVFLERERGCRKRCDVILTSVRIVRQTSNVSSSLFSSGTGTVSCSRGGRRVICVI